MDEVSGPVVSIALILAAVFVPVGLDERIQGRLNQQFAVTIAISVLISAFNALTLSPALAAMILRPAHAHAAGRARSSAPSTAAFDRSSRGYLRVSGVAHPKGRDRRAACWRCFGAGAVGLGRRLPTSFIPEEDYGYFLLNVHASAGGLAGTHGRDLPRGRPDPRRDAGRARRTRRSSASACSRA